MKAVRKGLSGHGLSPAMIVGILAVVLAIGGTATAALHGKDKKKVRAIADQEISAQAPGIADKAVSAKAPGIAAGVADQAITSRVPGIADQEITRLAPSLSVGNADSLGGVAAAGYQKGGGHTVNATLAAQNGALNNQLLDIPGIGQLLFDCGALGSTPKLHNSSGGPLAVLGQTQHGPTVVADPNVAAINTGDTVTLTSRISGLTTIQLWNVTSGKTATITFSNLFCSFTASAVTNQ
jgi:hypothetical protein